MDRERFIKHGTETINVEGIQPLSQAQIERRIHTFRILRAKDIINSAQYRMNVGPLYSSLKCIKRRR